MTTRTERKVKAWIVTTDSMLRCYGTIVEDISGTKNVWQYPIFLNRKEALSFKKQKGYKNLKVVLITITYRV